jgi:light-regulated signal transduction histidine kinase (bacteriophytochrome)
MAPDIKLNEDVELEKIQQDLVKLFDGYRREKENLAETQKAILNILDDFVSEKVNLENYQKALLNILDDYDSEKEILQGSQKALLNILDDYQDEKNKVEKTNQELILSNKELESFSYSVSHDLRAPIRAINSFSAIIRDKYYQIFDDEGKEYMDIIFNEAIRMGHLIDDLLSFSRLGKKELQKNYNDMNLIVRNAVDEVNRLSDEKYSAKVKIKKLPSALCDGALMHQVFVNLLSNAFKYSRPKAKPVIEIGASQEDGSTIFYVKDNGVGFDMKYYDKLFGVFHRLHSDDQFKGTGIGLAVVQRIVIRHGGRVRAEGKVGQGATFYFSLPS